MELAFARQATSLTLILKLAKPATNLVRLVWTARHVSLARMVLRKAVRLVLHVSLMSTYLATIALIVEITVQSVTLGPISAWFARIALL